MKTVLSIAGSDSSGGAGIQADLKTILAHDLYGMSVITAMTAQNTMGVRSIFNSSDAFFKDQLDSVFEDIYPDAVKIGMLSTLDLTRVLVERLRFYQAKNIVLDPVMIATSGADLFDREALDVLKKELIPLVSLVTPNMEEAEVLSGLVIHNREDMEKAAQKIYEESGCAVLLKGGHRISDADDYFFDGEGIWFTGERINNPNSHGTGCTLSSAIASNLAKCYSLKEAIKLGKDYVTGTLKSALKLGKGSGPLDHAYQLRLKIQKLEEN